MNTENDQSEIPEESPQDGGVIEFHVRLTPMPDRRTRTEIFGTGNPLADLDVLHRAQAVVIGHMVQQATGQAKPKPRIIIPTTGFGPNSG